MTEPRTRARAKLSYLYAGGAAALGGFATFSVMAADAPWRWGVPVAIAALAMASVALMMLVRADNAVEESDFLETPMARLVRPLVGTGASLAVFFLALWAAAAGRLPVLAAAIVVPGAFLALVAAVFHLGVASGAWATDESAKARPLFRRHGFWVIALATLLYLPMLGSFSLIDPWEPRYGAVARDMLARSDWISPWFAQDGWDWTKPVLDYWVQALAMGVLGVDFRPDQILGGATGVFARPEWAVRMPSFLLATIAVYLLYKAVAAWHGRRAGLLGALVLATMPHWFFLAHQSMTDMPLVAPMSSAIALVLLALRADPEKRVRTYAVTVGARTLRFDAGCLVLGIIVMTALAQILYLASRNVELQWVATPHGFRAHLDTFSSGSPGNCGLPGNEPCTRQLPRFTDFQPALQAALWAGVVAALVWIKRGERRAARLYAMGAWYFAALATMAKGPGGLVLPFGATLVYLLASRDWSKLLVLEIPFGLGVIAALVLPWYLAMYVRHGPAFTDQLVFHHMIQRATAHVHDTNEGDDVSFRYYIWQLGYALFPWTGLVPAALVGWMRQPERDENGRALPAVMFLSWFVLAFVLFASMPTKFHHYVFPAVPPAAMLTGLLLDRIWAGAEDRSLFDVHERRMIGGIGIAAAIVVALVGRDLIHDPTGNDIQGQVRLLHLFTYQYRRAWPDSLDFRATLTGFATLGVGASLLLVVDKWRRYAVLAYAVTALAFAGWGLDVYLVRCAPHWGQRELFTRYYAERRNADELVIAYQLNWRGENFYTANHVPVFVSSGQPFSNYMRGERDQGKKTFYFVTEHSRTDSLRSEIGTLRTFERLTDARLNNKFALIRVTFD
ncbi:MAG TPA: glycosyltransferase family 39 protein [Polyangiaceae bacterium]|nr:glycosyltransferase family 39 protein [Polyangiaceae bacterium]